MDKITMEFIKNAVEKVSGIDDMSLYKREKEYPLTRYVAFKLSREYLPKEHNSLESIAKAYGLKTHCSALAGINKFDNYKNQDFFSPYLKRYELAKIIIIERINGLDNQLDVIKKFNANNQDLELKSSISRVVSFLEKFYKTA